MPVIPCCICGHEQIITVLSHAFCYEHAIPVIASVDRLLKRLDAQHQIIKTPQQDRFVTVLDFVNRIAENR